MEVSVNKRKPSELIRFYISHVLGNLRVFFKWIMFAAVTGIVVGMFSILFGYCMNLATQFRTDHEKIILFLPIAGLVIVWLYNLFDYKNDKGTNLVLSTIHAEAELPFKMAPLIFISTVLTHLFGGSAGREGAALQLGGSIGNQLGRWFHMDDQDKRVIVMCGMSAAFSALFGTPVAAAVFSMEVVSVGVMYYAALVPCVFSSVIASHFAVDMGMHGENFHVLDIPELAAVSGLKIVVLAMLCAALSVLFCILLHGTGDLYRKYLKNRYLRIALAGMMVAGLYLLLGTADYCGAGIPVITKAVAGEVTPLAFFWKMLFTAITIEAGFKGGEIVPSFFIGATFGCLYGQIVGLSPSLCAAVGMVSVFCGVTNCPISSMLIAFEMFGFKGVHYILLAVAVSFMLSGYYGLYHDQTIVYSKYKTRYVNFKAKD